MILLFLACSDCSVHIGYMSDTPVGPSNILHRSQLQRLCNLALRLP